MARKRRSDLPDGPFHVIAHAVAAERLFYEDLDRRRYLGLLQQAVERYRLTMLTFVLMDNHVHMLVVSKTQDLSRGLWWLHSHYATYLLRRYPPRRGHVFESRPRTLPIRSEPYLLAVLRYVANNPVQAGICSSPEAYRWSAHRAILGLGAPMPVISDADVLEWFGTDVAVARARYQAFVTGVDPPNHEEVRRSAEGRPPERPPLEAIIADGSTERIQSAHQRWGYSMREIAVATGLSPATISRRMRA